MYHYETLGDEKFQEFCQALIATSFPNAQCLPVGQPDGGRDAFQLRQILTHRERRRNEKELVVFQVKYIKNPQGLKSEREVLKEIIKKESPKIERLKSAGMSRYYLITNLKGTSHFGIGSIDQINKELSDAFTTDAYCWWRDDLDRRLDNNSSIKWSYPEILKATDLLEKLVHGQLGEDGERRKSAIRAYITAQYEDDQELKFKQTDLRSTMTDLFVDLPMRESHEPGVSEEMRVRRYWNRTHRVRDWSSGEHLASYGNEVIPSAEYLVARRDAAPERIVLEGAPGQGKSTVTQYVSQVLRMHLLNKVFELQHVPPAFRQSPVRIPFRVDLRDMAKWIAGVNPFQPKQTVLTADEPKSLEGFLAAQVRSVSGGHSFNVSDLNAVARTSHILLALDGFDEVADVGLRQQLVDEITKGTSRLSAAGNASIITIVTSRPAAFAKSVVFPREIWTYFELLPLETHQIDEYTKKWTKAKGLKTGEETQLRRILEAKLKEAHTQYLAKNPMQLTILLSLVHSRGPSLPEKRTSMYDTYMDMFFSRESEKSDVVRDNRELLIDIHRYLAWKLQTAAEAGDNGSIEHSALRVALFEYLDREGENTAIVDSLFNGIIERVGALVSRVQETYEFEVQPLREYFAARHLYETSPYPSDDRDSTGDKFDRFQSLASNPYWLNVARFYGGCFNKGELLTLANEITELSIKPPYALTSHPRSVAMMLLSDWVFSAYQPAAKQVIAFVSEQPQLRQLLANAEETGSSLWANLPERSGRAEFLESLWERAIATRHDDERRAVANAISQNSTVDERIECWNKLEAIVLHREWIQLGAALRIYNSLTMSHISSFGKVTDDILEALLVHRRFDILNQESYFEFAMQSILRNSSSTIMFDDGPIDERLSLMTNIFATYQYWVALGDDTVPLRVAMERRVRGGHSSRSVRLDTSSIVGISDNEKLAIESYLAFTETDTSVLSTSTAPWKELVEALRKAWGDCPAIDRIAFLGAGVKSKHDIGVDCPLLNATDLVGSVRFVRMKSGAYKWWEEKLASEVNVVERGRYLQLLALWGTPKTLLKLGTLLDELLNALSDNEWVSLNGSLAAIEFAIRDEAINSEISAVNQLKDLGLRANAFIGRRLSNAHKYRIAINMSSAKKFGSPEMNFIFSSILGHEQDESRISNNIDIIKRLYHLGASMPYMPNHLINISPTVAAQVSEDLESFPLRLIAMADSQLRSSAGAMAPKLLEVARSEKWFHH